MKFPNPLAVGFCVVAVASVLYSCNQAPVTGSFQQQPPAKYQGDNLVVVRFLDPDKVPAACTSGVIDMNGGVVTACVLRAGTVAQVMIVPNPCTWPNVSDIKQIMCHELGHANGWPANHPTS